MQKKKLKKNIKTYTIFSDDKKYNEFKSVKKTLKELNIRNHKWVRLDKNNTFKNLKIILNKKADTFTNTYKLYSMEFNEKYCKRWI